MWVPVYPASPSEAVTLTWVLSDLTAEDLKELGVGPIGHRRRLLTAIAALRGNSRHALAEVEPTADLKDAKRLLDELA